MWNQKRIKRAAETSNVSDHEVKGHTGLLDLSTNGENMQMKGEDGYFVLCPSTLSIPYL